MVQEGDMNSRRDVRHETDGREDAGCTGQYCSGVRRPGESFCHSTQSDGDGGATVPDLGLWRPLGNNIIENTSTPWPNKFNDCNDMCGIIMLQLTMSPNLAAVLIPLI